MNLVRLWALVKKEFLLEFRQKASFGGVLIYVVATVFISALSFNKAIAPATWNALFWIIFLFTSITICGKSFVRESQGVFLFNYFVYSPHLFITAKLIYNFVFLLLTSVLTLFFFSWFVGNPVQNQLMFLFLLFLSSWGFSTILTLMSAIAARAENNFTLVSILSFPVLIPLLVLSLRVGKQALDGLSWSVSVDFLLIIGSINVICLVLCLLLFPYLWRA